MLSVIPRFPQCASQFLAVFVASIGAISDGMHYGWTSPVLEILESNDSYLTVTHEDHKWLEDAYLIGGIAGLPVSIYFVDKFGRKKCIFVGALVALISWILIAIADNILYFYFARFIAGITGNVAFVAIPMYISEIADKTMRGFLSGIIYIMMLIGILLIYSIAPYAPLYVPSIFGGGVLTIQLIFFPFMPDSPYYLISRGMEEKAKENLKTLRGGENIEDEFLEISKAMKHKETDKKSLLNIIKSKASKRASLIVIFLNVAQHFSSFSVLLMNLHPILTAANSIYLSANVSGIIFSFLMLIGALLADGVVDKCGRKLLLIVSSLFSAVSLFVLALYFTLQKNEYNIKYFSWLPIASVMIYAFVFKLGMGIIPSVLTAELFPTRVKAIGMTISDLFYEISGLLSIEVYMRLVDSAGYDYPFYIFAVCCLGTAIFTYFYIPETKGKSLEEIQDILNELALASNYKDCELSSSIYIQSNAIGCKNNEMGLSQRQPALKQRESNDKV